MVRTIKRANTDDMESCVTKRSFLSSQFGVNASRIHLFEIGVKSIPLHNDWLSRPIQIVIQFKQSDFMAHGTSDRCPGCRALVSGGCAQSHNEECRIRVEGELRKTEEGKAHLRSAASRVGMLPHGVH